MNTQEKFKFKKVAWISDRKFPEYEGGAEKVDYMIREIGKKQGLEIDHWKDKLAIDYDLYILGNNHLWPPEKTESMVDGKQYAFFRHDPLAREHVWDLVRKAHVVIFPSPGLKAFYEKKLILKNVMYQPWASAEGELDSYYSKTKENFVLYIGDLNSYKGVHNLIDYAKDHPEMLFKVYGRNMENINFTLPNLQYFGWLPEDKVRETMAKAKYWIQLPSMIDPFPQMVVKAYLSGCELIVNKNVGCFTYPDWDWNDPENIKKKLREFQETFWQRLNAFY